MRATRRCDICADLDGDRRPKAVEYCKPCDAWKCERCRSDPMRQGLAAARSAGRKVWSLVIRKKPLS